MTSQSVVQGVYQGQAYLGSITVTCQAAHNGRAMVSRKNIGASW